MASRPSSRQSFVDGGLPLPERQESAAKTLLTKGTRMLKRQGSKLNLLPSQLEDRSNVLPEARVGEMAPVKSLQRQPTLISRRLKRSISGPFAFQHLTHGDQAQFQSLDSVSKTDLTSEFNAVHADQQPVDQIRGIPVTDLPVNGDESKIHVGFDEPTSPTTSAIPYLPTTPTRPSPPPKDTFMPPYSPEFRLSRSMENFSRPTRLSVTAVDISPSSDISKRLSAMSPISQARALAKPLPHLPDDQVVHAVSTRDDIALPLRTAPLPSPPRAVMEVVEEESVDENATPQTVHASVQPLIPHASASPSAKQHKRRSQSSGEIHFDVVSHTSPCRMSTTETTAVERTGGEASPKSKNRFSVGVKPIDIGDWEDAIDYSWEHAADLEDDNGTNASAAILSRPSTLSIPRENYLVVEQQSIDEASSSASTPLTMQMPSNLSRDESGPSQPLEQEPSSPLLGLGIESLKPIPTVSLDEAAVSDSHQPENNLASTDAFRARVMRSPVSTMSKSSSQESIIASIFGTHRSSNSSTTLSDLAHLASFGNSMESLKLDLQDFSSGPDKHFREGSQDTIREDSHCSNTADSHLIESFGPFAPSPTIRHDRGASASQVPVPERKSSMPGVELSRAQAGRKRANTATSRPRRNTRVSYSLFPTNAAN
ncbi:uncharacterized protein A1O5_04576 [Cladophialophora psammophila CBS 110553]|uniref:CRIB domain-containing protein n=1 Tax=Cladophialophora psammophila CBS 110553 TaxID=1182543 RepID=W9WVV1_9EURO|nr:uncharacterized protein A1O5_04576 [Cladophialophora psammophila CBS 110553]EXJ72073.1 hypothetical protein A1O5_04576 [Cladophialophora psammophila CBS 110553]